MISHPSNIHPFYNLQFVTSLILQFLQIIFNFPTFTSLCGIFNFQFAVSISKIEGPKYNTIRGRRGSGGLVAWRGVGVGLGLGGWLLDGGVSIISFGCKLGLIIDHLGGNHGLPRIGLVSIGNPRAISRAIFVV